MKKFSVKFGFLFLLLFIFFCSATDQSGEKLNSEITPSEVKAYLDSGKVILIIDVRTMSEYVGPLGHIPEAILRPVQEIESWISEFDSLKNEEIVIVCKSGRRSGFTTNYLLDNGYSKVFNMIGGMLAWNELGYPMITKLQEDDEQK
jgi:rhodanese-related sulfurtransferase